LRFLKTKIKLQLLKYLRVHTSRILLEVAEA
jgi:hypothetical protein